MPALGTSSHSLNIDLPATLGTSKKKAVKVPNSRGNLSYGMDQDFGAYLLSSSPPVNFALSYSIDDHRGKPRGVQSQPWLGQKNGGDCNGNKQKINNHYDLFDYQRMNRWSADMSDIRAYPQRRDASPSFRTRKSGCISNGSDSLNHLSNRSKIRSCIRSRSLYDLQSEDTLDKNSDLIGRENSIDSTRIKRDSRLNKKVSFADDVGRRLYMVRIFEESPDMPSFIEPSLVLKHSQKNGNHQPSKTSGHFRSNGNGVPSSSSCREANGTTPRSSSSPSLCDSAHSSAASSSTSSSSEAESSEKDSERCLLVPNFSMPAASYKSFRRKIEEHCVSLETVHQMEYTGNLWGTIKVREMAFEKQVFVRVTFDGWLSHTDVEAEYVVPTDAASLGGRVLPFATFSFRISLPSDNFQVVRHGVQFAVCYRSAGQEFWDSNSGANYEFKSPDWAGSGLITSSTGRRGSVESAEKAVFSAAKTESWSAYASWTDADASVPYW